MTTLRQPSRERARDNPEHGGCDHHGEQRRGDRKRGVFPWGERVERNGDELTVGEGEGENGDSDDGEDDES